MSTSSPNRVESKQINFRVTTEEFNRISEMAMNVGLSVSGFCKLQAKKSKIRTPNINREGALKIASELRRIGSNVNQVAKYLNSGYNVTEEQINAIEGELNSIWQLLNLEIQNQPKTQLTTAKKNQS